MVGTAEPALAVVFITFSAVFSFSINFFFAVKQLIMTF